MLFNFGRRHKYIPSDPTRYVNTGEQKLQTLPVLYQNRENCCGCSVCCSICPVKAISMKPDEEGFLYPVIDAKKCIACQKCISVCVFKMDQKEKGYL